MCLALSRLQSEGLCRATLPRDSTPLGADHSRRFMAATAINGIRHSKSGAKAGMVATWGFDAGWGVVRDMGWR